MSEETLIHLDDDNFTNSVSDGVTLIDFSAEWCGPCRMLHPVIVSVAEKMKGKAKVAKVDIDASQKTAQEFNITSVPMDLK
jgi:thioredoxin 1